MSVPVTTFVFFALVLFCAVLPFVPALRELQFHRDATPLTVSRRSRVDVRHFANGLRDFLQARLGWVMNEVRQSRTPAEGHGEGVGSYVVVPSGAELEVATVEGRLVVGTGELVLRGAGELNCEVYAAGDLCFTHATRIRAVLSEGDLELAPRSRILRWVHAGHHLVVGEETQLFGRASADEALFLRPGTFFERLHAPTILVGVAKPEEPTHPDPDRRLDPGELGHNVDVRANRVLVEGDLQLPANSLVECDIVARGNLYVGPGARVRGSLKAHGQVVVEEGAWLEGAVVAVGRIEIRRGTYVHGPILTEEELWIGVDARIGDLDRPSTARARSIEITERARVHGSLWAAETGKVVSS